MIYLLSLAELYATAVLTGTNEIFGLDLASEVPTAASDRQALYEQGEQQLIQKGLMIELSAGQVQMQQDFLRAIRTVMQPRFVLVSVLTLPERGRSLRNHYLLERSIVELLPMADDRYQLRVLAGVSAIAAGLAESVGAGVDSAPELEAMMPTAVFVECLRSAADANPSRAQQLMAGSQMSAEVRKPFQDSLLNTKRILTSLMLDAQQAKPGGRELACLVGAGHLWLGLAENAEQIRVQTLTRAQLEEIYALAIGAFTS